MVVGELELKNFRNFQDLRLKLHPSVNVFIGENGAGKTNLLESIYFITHLRSFRTQNPRSILRQPGAERALIRSEMKIGKVSHGLEITFGREGKTVFLDDKRLELVSEYVSDVYSMILATDRTADFKNNPKSKRTFFDRFSLRSFGGYVNLAKEQKIVRNSRSALIRGKAEKQIPAWNALLIKNSLRIFEVRKTLTDKINHKLSRFYAEITGKNRKLKLNYKSDLKHEERSPEEIGERLKEKWENEVRCGFCLYGPHRDVFSFEMDEKDEKFGFSQGEYKSSFLSALLSLNEILLEAGEDAPLLLFDDVFSELDPTTASRLFGHLKSSGNQIFITTPSEPSMRGVECGLFEVGKPVFGKVLGR